jgi:hypothetical protein
VCGVWPGIDDAWTSSWKERGPVQGRHYQRLWMSSRDEIFGRSWRLALSALALSDIVDDSEERNEKKR